MAHAVRSYWAFIIDEAHQIDFFSRYACPPGPQPTFTGCVLLALYYQAEHWVKRGICFYFGHVMIGDGWAGPDSGGEAWHCDRCGVGDSVIYY